MDGVVDVCGVVGVFSVSLDLYCMLLPSGVIVVSMTVISALIICYELYSKANRSIPAASLMEYA